MRLLVVLLSIISNYKTESAHQNLYGTVPFKNVLINLLGATAGMTQFALEDQQFMSTEPSDRTPDNGDKFDFIVVGAGTAGATIASRLSEIPEFRVLLIEAGGSENLAMDIPIFVNYLQFSDDINWKYQTEPSDDFCRGMVNQRCNWPRGKVMGGSSVLNYMIATRGDPRDYNHWADLGNEGWSWNDLLPYFKKLESFQVPEHKNNKNVHNDDGPLFLNYTEFRTPLAKAFLEAGVELGYKTNIDYNSGEEPVGFSYLHTNIKNGWRMSSSKAYLHPVRRRKNLIISKNSLVSKVLFDDNKKKAIGVEYQKGNRNFKVYATKEVILSAGAIGSPQILMLSGIGPAKHLKEKNIDLINDLPVGENLMDHIAYGGLIFTINQPVGMMQQELANPTNPYMRDFFLNRKGPYTVPGGCEGIALLDVDNPNDHNAYPNIELLFVSSSFATVGNSRYSFGISDDMWNKSYAKIENSYTWTVYPLLLRPKSRGRILLRDNNINSKPLIYPNYMSDKEDIRILIKGIKTALKISKTRAMQNFGSKLFQANLTQCEGIPENTNDFWECVTRTITMNIFHYTGTCKMGPKNDSLAVVDARLRVHGIKGLRVADGSIIPEIISGHPNIPIFMIGEKLSDMVKEDWGF